MDDIYVYVVDMNVDEAVSPCNGFGYTVYINAHLSQEQRAEAFKHALQHIQNEDFDCSCCRPVQEMEVDAHGEIQDH